MTASNGYDEITLILKIRDMSVIKFSKYDVKIF